MDHAGYWRDFREWAIERPTEETDAALAALRRILPRWMALLNAGDSASGGSRGDREEEWRDAVSTRVTSTAVSILSDRERETVRSHYGLPVRIDDLIEAYIEFGRGDHPLPEPEQRNEPLAGPGFWLVWGALADACLELELRPVFWGKHTRAFLAGLLADGLLRGRFPFRGFDRPIDGDAIGVYVRDLSPEDVRGELRRRLRESGLAIDQADN